MDDLVEPEDFYALEAPKHILLGNGFSIASGQGQFSYKLLADMAGGISEKSKDLLSKSCNGDFERAILFLEQAADVAKIYGHKEQAEEYNKESKSLREDLISVVRKVHPKYRSDINESSYEACGKFLKNFSNVFTVNYDLILYWTLLKIGGFSDGFGLDLHSTKYRKFNIGAICNTYYLHGALHLFDENGETIKRKRGSDDLIMDAIENSVESEGRIPMFVAEGEAKKKAEKIRRSPYLSHCLEKLRSIEGVILLYGHSAAANDSHILDSIWSSKVSQIYVSVHEPKENLEYFKESVGKYALIHKKEIGFIDASKLDIWGLSTS